MIDVARAYRSGKFNQSKQPVLKPYTNSVIDVINESYELKYGQAVIINSAMSNIKLQTDITGIDNVYSYLNNEPLNVVKTQLSDEFDSCGIIVQQSIINDDIISAGKMVTAGLAVARFLTANFNPDHKRAYCGDDGKLISGDTGPHEILYHLDYDIDNDETEDTFAIIHLNTNSKDTDTQFYARINAYEDDVIGRKWLYEWSQVIPDDDSIGNGWSGPVDNLTWASQYSPGVIYGKARNSIENESGIVLQRPIRVGTVVKIKVQKEVFGGTQPIMIFSATNNETSFFAEIGSYSAGLYNWTECNPDGSAIINAQTGNALNTYYGTSLLPGSPKIIPAGKIVLMQYLADQNQVGFCLSMQSPGSNDMRGDEMVTQPATLPTPYPPTDGSGVLVGQPGALISVMELDDPDNIGERIRRIYHLPPTVNDPSAQYDCVQFTTTDGGDTDGGGTGSVVNTIQNVQPDAWGHTVITEDNPEVTWTTSRNINIRGTDTNPIIEHSLQGASVGMHTVITDAATNSVNIAFTGFDEDVTGHIKHNAALDVIVNVAGDDDIAVGLPTLNNIEITHKVPTTVSFTIDPIIAIEQDISVLTQMNIRYNKMKFNATGHFIGVQQATVSLDMATLMDAWLESKKVLCPQAP